MSTHILTEAGDFLVTEAGDDLVTEDSVAEGALLDAYPDALKAVATPAAADPFEADSRIRGG
jgi:hypothetical protein